jgi:hypothetical protein
MDRRLILTAALVAPALAASPADASEGGKERKKGGGANFVQIPTLTASLVKADNRRGVLTVEAGVDAPTPALHARVVSLQPRLRDGYNAYLARFGGALRPGFVPDADLLARELQAITDRIAGRGCRLLLGTILVN